MPRYIQLDLNDVEIVTRAGRREFSGGFHERDEYGHLPREFKFILADYSMLSTPHRYICMMGVH
jgi:hypothetical protein